MRAYVGSPLVIPDSPRAEDLPSCAPGASRLSARLRLLGALGLCGGSSSTPPGRRCRCWDRLIRFHLRPLLAAHVDAIGFDSSPDFHPGDCMDRLVRRLMAEGTEVMIESWPRPGRTYPAVTWIIREQRFQRILFEPRDDVPVPMVEGTIHRIIPVDESRRGREEIELINRIRARHGASAFSTTQEIVDGVRSDGHIPLVRSRQLLSGAVT